MRRGRSAVVIRLTLLVALASLLAVAGRPVLETGGAGDVTLRRCRPEGYGLEWRYVRPTTHAPKEIRLTTGWATFREGRRPCLLHTTIRLAISGSSGATVSVDWHVNSVRRPWSSIERTWAWKNWCQTDPKATTRFDVSAPGERTTGQPIPKPPVCVNPDAPSTLTDLGTGTTPVPRSERIPAHFLSKRIPPPLHWELVNPKNAWLVSDGYTLAAVYAGNPGAHPAIGVFGIVRQNAIFGFQYNPPDLVYAGRIGAVKITRAPRGRSRETTAQYARLAFVSANGTKGFLDLNGDRVRITSRP